MSSWKKNTGIRFFQYKNSLFDLSLKFRLYWNMWSIFDKEKLKYEII